MATEDKAASMRVDDAAESPAGGASWSVWLHTPEWGPGNAGLTLVMCRACALEQIEKEARRGTR